MSRLLAPLVLVLALPAHAGAPRAPLRVGPVVAGPHDVALIVKWDDALRARVDDAGRVRWGGHVDDAVEALRRAEALRFEPWLALPERRLSALERRAERGSGVDQPDLAGLHRVVVPDQTPERLEAVGAALAALEGVEFVTTEAAEVPPPVDLDPVTPDLVPRQGWLGVDPGVDAWAAWEDWGLDGAGIRLADCEYGWHHDHEDLVGGDLDPEPGQTPRAEVASRGWDHHGTAVGGELIGQHNGYGIRGLAPAATFATYPEWTVEEGPRRGSAIASAIDDSAPGDVVLLEMQAGGPDGRLAPAEVNPAVWTVVRLGTDAGVIVVGAAGNGSADLDSGAYATYRDWGDSGAILVGAGSSDGRRARLGFSTYGSRIDVQGWGQNVFTTGYGAFARYGGDVLQTYTHRFSGTSSASPFVAGSAVLLQQAALRYRVEPLSPRDMRALLVDTGRPGPVDARIGPLPDLAAALDALEAAYDIPPALGEVVGPDAMPEGAPLTLTPEDVVADHALLPTHTPRWSWTVDGVPREGETLTLDPRDDGPVELTLTLTDDWDRLATASATLLVENLPPAVSVDPVGPVDEGTPVTLTATATDPGPDEVTLTWTLDGAVLGTGPSLDFTPPQDGTWTLVVTPEDDEGAVGEPVQIVLEVRDVPPALTLEVPAQAPRKTPTDLAVRIDDPGEDTFTVAWTLDAEGTAATGTSITHTWEAREAHPVRVVVTDQDGVEVTAEATVEVVRRQGCGCAGGPVGGLIALPLVALGMLRRRRSRRSR